MSLLGEWLCVQREMMDIPLSECPDSCRLCGAIGCDTCREKASVCTACRHVERAAQRSGLVGRGRGRQQQRQRRRARRELRQPRAGGGRAARVKHQRRGGAARQRCGGQRRGRQPVAEQPVRRGRGQERRRRAAAGARQQRGRGRGAAWGRPGAREQDQLKIQATRRGGRGVNC